MSGYAENLFNDNDIEALHKMRVAARRLKGYMKVYSRLFPKSKFNKAYGKLRYFIRTLGAIRELDVSVELIEDYLSRHPVTDNRIFLLYISRLRNKKAILRASLSKNGKIQNFLNSGNEFLSMFDNTLKNIQKNKINILNIDKSFRENSSKILPLLFKKTLKLKNEVFNHPRKAAELHALRIKTKPLRYIFELYLDIYSDDFNEIINFYKNFVERTGTIHDIDVIIPGAADFLREIRIYNKSIKRKDRISTTPLVDFIKKNREKRKKQFGIICGMLGNWDYIDFKNRIFELTNQNSLQNPDDARE